jgi:hypothetical protein
MPGRLFIVALAIWVAWIAPPTAQTRIAGVMVGGRWIPKAEIDRHLGQMRR